MIIFNPHRINRIWLQTYQYNVNLRFAKRPIIYPVHRLKKSIIRRNFAWHKIQVTSYGGSGTTMLCRYLSDCNVGMPKISEGDWAPWKHMSYPPEDRSVGENFRAIYLISDPREALYSVFRRRFQHWHIQRMDGNLKNRNFSWGIDDFIGKERDLFRFQDQFESWTTSKRKYPILIIKYEALWKHVPELLEFAGVPPELHGEFPKQVQRKSILQSAPIHVQEGLDRIYQKLLKGFKDLPDYQIRKANI